MQDTNKNQALDDPELNYMIGLLKAAWLLGDPYKGWAAVQFKYLAFPESRTPLEIYKEAARQGFINSPWLRL